MDSRGTVFREIHKNTWLKRLTLDNKKVTVGSKKSDRTWVVFCVHDDTEAMLEGYIEPRQAAFHTPEWTIPLQNTLHISHALIPSESEYEFVVTLATEVIRFNAASWEIMQEWVDTLRQKLREMKILSPKENLYSKLPEIRAPLLPTRDPTSPLPAPPPVPAAIVPGIEQVIPAANSNVITSSTTTTATTVTRSTATTTSTITSASTSISSSSVITTTTSSTHPIVASTSSLPATAMSNTLTQNLINMLTNPVTTYSSHVTSIIDTASDSSGTSINDDSFFFDDDSLMSSPTSNNTISNTSNATNRKKSDSGVVSLAKTFSNNVLADPNTCPSTSGLNNHNATLITERNDHETDTETSSTESTTPSTIFKTEPLIIPRPQTSRNSSRNKRTAAPVTQQITKHISNATTPQTPATSTNNDETSSTNITIIQVSSPLSLQKQSQKDVFSFPSVDQKASPIVELADDNYKSNVHIIPSNYSPPPLQSTPSTAVVPFNSIKTNISNNDQKVTTVQVSGSSSIVTGYGKICKSNQPTDISATTPTVSNTQSNETKIKNFGPVTNIPIGTPESGSTAVQLHYEQVFVTPSLATVVNSIEQSLSSSLPKVSLPSQIPKQLGKNASHTEVHINRINLHSNKRDKENNAPEFNAVVPSTSSAAAAAAASAQTAIILRSCINSSSSNNSGSNCSSNNISNNKKHVISGSARDGGHLPSPLPAIRQFLTRGLTEAAIIRPSRKDGIANPVNRIGRNKNLNSNKSDSQPDIAQQEIREQRRRSSSTSDAQGVRSRSYATTNNVISPPPVSADNRRMQPAPQPFRPENQAHHSTGRLTLREQQVLQLRREMMHPGGVRIQLRRKDCTGSIALVDAFGAVWISGWKQKEHPMLYNALHIGDQLVSVGGINVSTATETNRIIRNTPGLYIEFIIRRIPFGRVYAIRRELDGQCIGLIRDGNTATIVDVIPNSLSARHGLPPKAQSCDGLSLTFWVLTEINGRPLNLFFKENEVRDRLNAVGRDLSILVQPSDLITKLKKQLKSLRSHKDYIVQ